MDVRTPATHTDNPSRSRGLPRLLAATVSGTTMEFYDFFLYASATALVFNKLFFPSSDPLMGALKAFTVYAIGFLSRPLGGVLFGWVGDRYGRKVALVWTLGLMGLATVLVGALPTYDQVGGWAPVLLTALRLLQGLAVGGEWGGAVLLVAEHVAPRRRGLLSSAPQIGGPLGNLLSAGMLALLQAVMSKQSFLAWGWRLAFFASIVMIFIGLYARRQVEESPLFLQLKGQQQEQPAKAPLIEALRTSGRPIAVSTFLRIGENTAYYLITTFLIVYLTDVVHGSPRTGLIAIMVASVAQAISFLAGGWLSDRYGRRPMIIAGAVALAAWIFVYYPMVNTLQKPLIITAVALAATFQGLMVGASSAYFSEIFPTRVRYTAASLGYQLGSVFGGAIAPIIAIQLIRTFNSWVPVAIYIATANLLAGGAVLFQKNVYQHRLGE